MTAQFSTLQVGCLSPHVQLYVEFQFHFFVQRLSKYNCFRCFAESETQSQTPLGKHSGKENLPFNRKKPCAGPGLQGGTIQVRVSCGKAEKERERQEKESKGRERKPPNTRSNIQYTYINYTAMRI